MDINTAPRASIKLLVIKHLQLRSSILEVGIELVKLIDVGRIGVAILAVLGKGFEG